MAPWMRGFGLVELAVVAGIMSVVLTVLYQASSVGAVSSKKGISKLDDISKVNRLFEQLKRVLRTARIVIEEEPQPFDYRYTIVYVEEIEGATRALKSGRAKLSRRVVPNQGVEIEFAHEGEKPLVYPFASAVVRLYGARQLVMLQLFKENGERHQVTVASSYFDSNSSNLSPPEMVVVDLLGGATNPIPGATAASAPGARASQPPQSSPPVAGSAPGSTQTMTSNPFGGATTRNPSTVRPPTVASPGPQSGPSGGGVNQGVAGPAQAQPQTGTRATGPGTVGPSASTANSSAGLRGAAQPASGGATAQNGRPPGLRPPPDDGPVTWSGPASIDPRTVDSAGGTAPAAQPTPSGGRGATGAGSGGLIPPGMFDPPPQPSGTVLSGPAVQGGGSPSALTDAPVRPRPLGGPLVQSNLPPADVRVRQIHNQRPPRGNQTDVQQGSTVDSPFE